MLEALKKQTKKTITLQKLLLKGKYEIRCYSIHCTQQIRVDALQSISEKVQT